MPVHALDRHSLNRPPSVELHLDVLTSLRHSPPNRLVLPVTPEPVPVAEAPEMMPPQVEPMEGTPQTAEDDKEPPVLQPVRPVRGAVASDTGVVEDTPPPVPVREAPPPKVAEPSTQEEAPEPLPALPGAELSVSEAASDASVEDMPDAAPADLPSLFDDDAPSLVPEEEPAVVEAPSQAPETALPTLDEAPAVQTPPPAPKEIDAGDDDEEEEKEEKEEKDSGWLSWLIGDDDEEDERDDTVVAPSLPVPPPSAPQEDSMPSTSEVPAPAVTSDTVPSAESSASEQPPAPQEEAAAPSVAAAPIAPVMQEEPPALVPLQDAPVVEEDASEEQALPPLSLLDEAGDDASTAEDMPPLSEVLASGSTKQEDTSAEADVPGDVAEEAAPALAPLSSLSTPASAEPEEEEDASFFASLLGGEDEDTSEAAADTSEAAEDTPPPPAPALDDAVMSDGADAGVTDAPAPKEAPAAAVVTLADTAVQDQATKMQKSEEGTSAQKTPPQETQVAALPAIDNLLEDEAKSEMSPTLQVLFNETETEVPLVMRASLKKIVQQLQQDSTLQVRVVAYAGGDEAQARTARRVSLSRALAVRAFLIESGVENLRINVEAMGNRHGAGAPDRADIFVFVPGEG